MSSTEQFILDANRSMSDLHEKVNAIGIDVAIIKSTMPVQPCRDVQDLIQKQHDTEDMKRIEDTQKSGAFWGVVQKVASVSITAGLSAACAWIAIKAGVK